MALAPCVAGRAWGEAVAWGGGGCWGASRVVGQPFPGGCSGRTRSHLLFWLQSLFAQLLGGTLGFWHSPHFPSQTLNPVLFPQPNAVGLWQKRH